MAVKLKMSSMIREHNWNGEEETHAAVIGEVNRDVHTIEFDRGSKMCCCDSHERSK